MRRRSRASVRASRLVLAHRRADVAELNDAIRAVQTAIEQSDPYSMIFLDIRMPPGLDGYETASEIRKIDPLVYIVFVSGYSDYTKDELLDVAGGDYRTGFLCKPVWPHQLMSTARSKCAGPGTEI